MYKTYAREMLLEMIKNDKFKYKGRWRLSNKPEKSLGTLRFSPNEEAILNLIGSFKDIKDFKQVLNQDIILGDCAHVYI